MSLRWMLYDEDFVTDVFDPMIEDEEEEEEIICTSSGRGRLFQHSYNIPRIPLKLLKLINTDKSFVENDFKPDVKPLPAMPSHLSRTTQDSKPVPAMPAHLTGNTREPLPAIPVHLSRTTPDSKPLPAMPAHLSGTTQDNKSLPTMPAHMSGVRNETSVRSRGRGRAQRLKQNFQNCQSESSSKNVVPIQPFGVPNPKPRILRPEEMFIKRHDDIKGLHLASDTDFRSFSGTPPPSKDMQNFEDEFPSLSSSDEQQIKHKELRNNLDKLSPSKTQLTKSPVLQVPQETSNSFKDLATSSLFTNNTLLVNHSTTQESSQEIYSAQKSRQELCSKQESSQEILSAQKSRQELCGRQESSQEILSAQKSRQELCSTQEKEHDVNKSCELRNLTSALLCNSSSSTTLSPNQTPSTSLSSSINDVYYSSLTSTDEKEEQMEIPQSKQSPQKSAQEQWSLCGEHVIQLDGLPLGCDACHIEELIATFGTVEDSEIMFRNTTSSLRFRLSTSDACDWAVSCLDDTDSLYPEFNCILSCFRVM